MLKEGNKAPKFELYDQNGDLRTLDEFSGRKLVLYFYAKDNTSGCTAQAKGYACLNDEFNALGYTVIGVSKDSVKSHKGFEEKQELPFILLSDPDKKTIAEYGVWGEKKMYGKTVMGVVRSTFVIGEDGTVKSARYKVKGADDPAQTLEIVKGL